MGEGWPGAYGEISVVDRNVRVSHDIVPPAPGPPVSASSVEDTQSHKDFFASLNLYLDRNLWLGGGSLMIVAMIICSMRGGSVNTAMVEAIRNMDVRVSQMFRLDGSNIFDNVVDVRKTNGQGEAAP